MQEQRLTSAMVGGNSGPGHGTKVGTIPRVEASGPRSNNVVKRPHIQRVRFAPVPSPDAKQSQGISTQCIELVVITDIEPESSEDDKN